MREKLRWFYDLCLYYTNELFVKMNAWKPDIMTLDETMNCILNQKVSISRFGDGEYKWMLGIPQHSFQESNTSMQKDLIRVFHSSSSRLLLCTSDYFGSLSSYKPLVRHSWSRLMLFQRKKIQALSPASYRFGNLNITRFYMDYKDCSHVPRIIQKWKKVWDNKNLLIAEGIYTRLGMGNDLFHNAKSIRRILCPAQNAYGKYHEILHAIIENAHPDDLILLALGPTATILAADLSEKGYWAIDIGHIDIEYEWYLKGATDKIPIVSKYVNEAGPTGRTVGDIQNPQDQKQYAAEIVKTIS